MQTARNYITDVTANMERALSFMPFTKSKPLPSSVEEISRYVEELLTPEEQHACDMATD